MNTSAFVMMKRKHVQQQGLLYFPNTYGTEHGCTREKVGVRWPRVGWGDILGPQGGTHAWARCRVAKLEEARGGQPATGRVGSVGGEMCLSRGPAGPGREAGFTRGAQGR